MKTPAEISTALKARIAQIDAMTSLQWAERQRLRVAAHKAAEQQYTTVRDHLHRQSRRRA
jgi:hypothetical protein